jgi:hypothetical protein
MAQIRRIFTMADQQRFACLSGDWNPMHMDAVAARRTPAGAPVVHGVHAVLWALNALAEQGILRAPVASVAAQFEKFVYLDTPTEISVSQPGNGAVVPVIVSGNAPACTLNVSMGAPIAASATVPELTPTATVDRRPNVVELVDMPGLAGWIAPLAPHAALAAAFPAACRCIGAGRVGEISLLSRLVGMICPGLHSVFASFAVSLVESRSIPGVGFEVTSANPRMRVVRMKVAGSGITGTVVALARWPPIEQATMARVASMVLPGEFAGSTALVIGGSRGLGALTAKVIAAGGGNVIVTYAVGRQDAECLAADIAGQLGRDVCRVLPFDTNRPAGEQLASIDGPISQLYHFASPRIFRQRSARFSLDLFQDFVRAYVTSFAEVCDVLQARGGGSLTAFYPSSVAVADGRPHDMTEYAMAKAAGEVLCSELNRSPGAMRVIVRRLPRLLTDQTATVLPVETPDPLETMLPIIREVQSAGG